MTYQKISSRPKFVKIYNFPELGFWSKVALTANTNKCWLWTRSVNSTGYGEYTYKGKRWMTHRLAWYLTNKIQPTKWILHSCDTRRCVNPNHLRQGTPKENHADMIERNRTNYSKGEGKWSSKLTEKNILEIREMITQKISQVRIAQKYGVDQTTISYIKRGKTWKHIETS